MSCDWIRADWPAPPQVIAGTTCRSGGASAGPYASLNLAAHVGDDTDALSENRRRFRRLCGLPAEPVWLRQVHGTDVAMAPVAAGVTIADAIVSDRQGVVCTVLTADCLPVLFVAQTGVEIAAAHAGWRGLCGGILEKTLAAMVTRPADILAWLGPAISGPAYEVGAEVRDAFLARDRTAAGAFTDNRRGRWQADLYGLARQRLRQAGVSRIYGGDRCTFAETDAFFSYRRDGECGRMATFIFRRNA